MITAERLRAVRGAVGILDLFRELGYPVAPVVLDPEPWRRAGIEIAWNGNAILHLAARLPDFDLFLLQGGVAEEAITKFLRSYREYNLLTKSALIYQSESDERISIYDLSASREPRRLDVDLAAPTAHAVDRLNLLATGSDVSLARVYDRALDRQAVTRLFFDRFRAAVNDVADELRRVCRCEEADAVAAEALLILSRLLFLSFVQEKGWLNGERRFLADRLERTVRERRELFATVLMPLFFGCLNTPVAERDAAARSLGRIPYLNGGLFEPSAFERRNPDLHLPNELMRRVIEDVFERFDFSVDERDAAGTNVDPEMLGKVFESLMAEDERAASGSFYTPREIVDVLTQRAIQWSAGGPSPARRRSEAYQLLQHLERITILDPACGSGAFLLSALSVIERLTRELSAQAGVEVPPDLRRRIVERSLFGVDLKPEAVRLCELRLWLAIVSGSEASIEDVRPLPNLDRNILQGNSLLSPTDFLGDGRGEIYRDWVWALRAQRDIIERYRTAPASERAALARVVRENDRRLASELLAKAIDADESELHLLSAPQRDLFGRSRPANVARCHELQARIAQNRRVLERVEEGELGFFSYDVHFAHVMANGGFDVVAGNPPWVRNSRIDGVAKRMYADRYVFFRADRADHAAFHQPDLSVVFFERALALAAPDGIVSMLFPAKVLNAAYAAPLRRQAAERLSILAIDDWSDSPRRPFDADTFPLGLTVRKTRSRATAVQITSCGESFTIAQDDLGEMEWELVPPDVGAILRRIRKRHEPLAKALGRQPVMGVKTGDNRSFFLEGSIRGGRFLTSDGISIPLERVCRCARGRDVRRWKAEATEWMLWPPAAGWHGTPRWLRRLAKSRKVEPSALRLSYVRPEHHGIKVAWKDVSRGMCAAVLPESSRIGARNFPLIPNQTLYVLDAASLDEAYALAALLNSTIADALLLCTAERAKDAHYRYFGRTVARIPLPVVSEMEKLVRASRRAHLGSIDAVPEIERIAAEAYGVSAAELELLRRFVDRRLARDAR